MKRSEYLKMAFDSYNSGKVSAEAYDAMVQNVDIFCEDEEYDDGELERQAEETEQEGAYLSFVKACYEKYKADWCSQRGYNLSDVVKKAGVHGELYVCLEEFEWSEFQDAEYMKTLLSGEDFAKWESFTKDPSLLPVDVICYGQRQHFDTRAAAIEFYKEGMLATEGSERERYSKIFCELIAGSEPVVSDGEPERGVRDSKYWYLSACTDFNYLKKTLNEEGLMLIESILAAYNTDKIDLIIPRTENYEVDFSCDMSLNVLDESYVETGFELLVLKWVEDFEDTGYLTECFHDYYLSAEKEGGKSLADKIAEAEGVKVSEDKVKPKLFDVTITETLKMTVQVEAKDIYEAEQMVSDNWHNQDYILDADNFTGVEFKAEPIIEKARETGGEER